MHFIRLKVYESITKTFGCRASFLFPPPPPPPLPVKIPGVGSGVFFVNSLDTRDLCRQYAAFPISVGIGLQQEPSVSRTLPLSIVGTVLNHPSRLCRPLQNKQPSGFQKRTR